MSKKNKQSKRQVKKSKVTEIRQIYCSQGHRRAFQNEIKIALSKAFEERWGSAFRDGMNSPLIAEVRGFQMDFRTTRANQSVRVRVCFRISYIVDYHGIYAERQEIVYVKLDRNESPDHIAKQIQEKEGDILETVRKGVSRLPGVFPKEYMGRKDPPKQFVKVSFLLVSPDYKKSSEVYFQTILDQIQSKLPDLNLAVSNELTACIQEALNAMGTLPGDVRPITRVGCRIKLSKALTFPYSITAAYQICFEGNEREYQTEISIPAPDVYSLFREKNEAAKDEIVVLFQEKAVSAFQEAYKNLPCCRMEPPEIVRVILKSGSQCGIPFGKIRARCELDLPSLDQITFFPEKKDAIGAVVWKKNGPVRKDNTFSLSELEKKMAKQVKMRSKKGLPNNPLCFINFCKEAASLYEGFKVGRIPVMPNLTFVYRKNKEIDCIWNGVPISLSTFFCEEITHEKTIRARLLAIFSHVADLEFERQNQIEEQVKILSTLHPTELLILKHVVQEGKSWFSQINEALDGKVMTTKVSTGPYLDHLCNMCIVQDGKSTPLLKYEWVSSRKHGNFRLYQSPVSWEGEALQRAAPCPFTIDNFSDFTPAGRERFFADTRKAYSNDESQWRILQVLEKMPMQFAAKFSKTEQGRELYQSFTGDDATYAQFFLASLPGCKRLAAKYFPRNPLLSEESMTKE